MSFKGLMNPVCRFAIPVLLCFSCSGISLNKGEIMEIDLTESKTLTIDGLAVTAFDFKEVFISQYDPDLKKNIHSSYPVFHLKLKKGGEEKIYRNIQYGAVIVFSGYEIKVTWSVVGTRDFPSNAKLKISKK